MTPNEKYVSNLLNLGEVSIPQAIPNVMERYHSRLSKQQNTELGGKVPENINTVFTRIVAPPRIDARLEGENFNANNYT